ncbi:MAG: HAD family hydrolase [Actinomycetota bacterium]|nr:HAD family hydrolase [Actinomycetota bacterium]
MSRHPALEAVVFDWGGTLSAWEADPAVYQGWSRDAWRAAAAALSEDAEDEIARRLLAAEAQLWDEASGGRTSPRLDAMVRQVAEELRLEIGEAALEEAAARFGASWMPNIVHDVDAPSVLGELRARGLKIGLLSNTYWPRSLHESLLERDGLADLIDVRVYSCELERTKPHPEAFGEVLERLGVSDPAAAVFVGDRPFDDIYGAKNAGMRAVLRPTPAPAEHVVEPDGVIEDLPGLLTLIDAWSRTDTSGPLGPE